MHKKLLQEKELQAKLSKETEIKDIQIEKVRKELKERHELKSNLLGERIALKKKDQEENLKRIKLQMKNEKFKLIEKIKESEILPRSKSDLKIQVIKAEAEKEFNRRILKH